MFSIQVSVFCTKVTLPEVTIILNGGCVMMSDQFTYNSQELHSYRLQQLEKESES